MGKPNKKRRRMNTPGGSVNRGDGKSTSDDAKVGSATTSKVKIPKASRIADMGTDDFKIVKTKLTFVDKSDKSKYIKNFFDLDQTVVGITAPRRFMKTTYMNMLKNFLEITLDAEDKNGKPISDPKNRENYKMFMGLQLGVEHPEFVKEHCGKYPIICMSLREVGGDSEKCIVDSLKRALCQAFEQHLYLVETAADGSKSFKNKKLRGSNLFLKYCNQDGETDLSITNVEDGLRFLSNILHLHHKKKVVVLIDEADTPIMTAIRKNIDSQLLEFMIDLISTLLTIGLKSNEHLERALLNSSVRLSGAYSTKLNNLYDVLFLQDPNFSSVYGFTADEVRDLLNKEEFQAVKDSEGIEMWYDGYQTLNNGETRIYNSWAVIKYLLNSVSRQKKMFDSYGTHSGLVDILGELFLKPKIQGAVDKLLEDEYIKIKSAEATTKNIMSLKNTIYDSQSALTDAKVEFFLQLLWDDGLLNAVEKIRDTVTLMIPNLEIKNKIGSTCYNQLLFDTKYELKPENIQKYIEGLQNLQKMASEEEQTQDSIKKTFQELCDAIAGLFAGAKKIPDNESEFHHVFYYLAYNCKNFTTQANRPAAAMKVSKDVESNTTHEKEVPQRKAKASTSTKPNETQGRKNEFDMLVILGIVAAIFEIKYNKKEELEKALAGLKQIFDREYFRVFDKDECKHVKTKIYIGLEFNYFGGKITVTMYYLVNSTDLNTAEHVTRTVTIKD